jgi:hypothetical protein
MQGAIRPENRGRIAAALKCILEAGGVAFVDTSGAAVFLPDACEGKFQWLSL